MDFGQPQPQQNDFEPTWLLIRAELLAGEFKSKYYSEIYQELLAITMKILALNELNDGNTEVELPELLPKLAALALERHEFGVRKYGVGLQPFNGRDQLKDSLEEVLDLLVYFRTFMIERDNKNNVVN